MELSDIIGLLTLVLLIALSAFFSSAETSLMATSRMRLRRLASEGDERAAILLKILDNQGKMLSTILIGNNIVNLSASSLATTLTIDLWGNEFVGLATGALTLFILVFGEITPKTAATIEAEHMALRYARYIRLLMWAFTPLVFIMDVLSKVVMHFMGIDPNKKQEVITEEELRTIVEVSQEEGVIEQEERKMITNVVDFGDSLAKDVMIPRINMKMVPAEIGYEELLEVFRAERFTRLPVYEGNPDHIIGVVNIKDLLWHRAEEAFSLRGMLRETFFTFEYRRTSDLLRDMRQKAVTIAVVLDEYGAVAGLITMEDLLEEIVGEIRDEYDEDELKNVQKLSEIEYLVEGAVKLDDLNEDLDLHLQSAEYDSVGGLVISRLGHLPKVGEAVFVDEICLTVDAMENNRITWVRLRLPAAEKD